MSDFEVMPAGTQQALAEVVEKLDRLQQSVEALAADWRHAQEIARRLEHHEYIGREADIAALRRVLRVT